MGGGLKERVVGGAAGRIILGACQALGVLSEQGSGQKQAERAEGSAVGRRGAGGGTDGSGDHNGQ